MSKLIQSEPNAETISRFQSLQAGQYWRALEEIPEEGIDKGMVLLLQSIRWVEDTAHTIVLRAHPSKIGTQETVEYVDEHGKSRTRWIRYDEHCFLLKDFLDLFEHEPEAQRVRAEETQAVHGRIASLQAELLNAQSDPTLLARVVEDALAREQPSSASGVDTALAVSQVDESHQQLANAATGTIAEAISSGITAETVNTLKKAASREHQIATIKAEWIQSKTDSIGSTIKALTPFYEEQAAAALAATEDVRTYVAKLMEGIESLDLYVGKDVDVDTVREGDAAPRDVPLTFVQKKLLMDEELAVWADIDEWFDFTKEALFFDALRAHDDLVRQIFPTERCVLVMAVTRRYIDYGDGLVNEFRNQESHKVFILVRNGMNIHRVFSPVESHLGTARLFPSRDDQEKIFRGLDGSQIKFEDVAYSGRHAAHERFALHFKRFLLLACGLDHRLKLFGDFYDGPPTLDFVSQAFQDKYCHFLHDDDGSAMLPGEERTPLSEWIAEKNAFLRSGSRVLCNWREVMNPSTAPAACKPNRDSYDFRYDPQQRMSVAIAYRDGQSLCVDVAVRGYTAKFDDRTFNCKVNLTRFKDGEWDYTDLPYLCLDAVEPEDLHWYIHNRDTRKNHLAYIRFFKHALKALRAEREIEQDTRQRLARALEDGGIATGDDAAAIVQQAAIAWRAANRGQALPSYEGSGMSTAWKSLLNQMYMLAGEGKRQTDDVAAFVSTLGYLPLRLVLSGGAKLVVYAQPKPNEMDDRLEPHPWVHRITVERGKARYSEKNRRWALLPKAAASETTIHQWPEAEQWLGKTSIFQSFDQKQALFSEVSGVIARLRPYCAQMNAEDFSNEFSLWSSFRRKLLAGAKYVKNPDLAVPFGLVYYPRSKELGYLCVGSWMPHAVLHRLAPDDAARQALEARYVGSYANKERATNKLQMDLAEKYPWSLIEVGMPLPSSSTGNYLHRDAGARMSNASGRSSVKPLLQHWFDGWKVDAARSDARYWIADDALTADGKLDLDRLLGITLPDSYDPVSVREIEIHGNDLTTTADHWFVICPIGTESNSLVEGLMADRDRPAYSMRDHHMLSPADARAFIQAQAEAKGSKAFPEAELPGANPAPGIERWFIASNTNNGKFND